MLDPVLEKLSEQKMDELWGLMWLVCLSSEKKAVQLDMQMDKELVQ